MQSNQHVHAPIKYLHGKGVIVVRGNSRAKIKPVFFSEKKMKKLARTKKIKIKLASKKIKRVCKKIKKVCKK